MRNRFDRQLAELNNELIEMGSLIEQAIEMGISALVKQDVEKAKKAIAFDNEIDHQEKEIENLCMKLLLQQQPVAKDLRLISAALKMITDMERIGDHAADISEMTILMADIVDDLFIQFKHHLIQMINENVKNGEQATDMLMVAKYFERIGDHATNIAEWVIYSITGEHED